VACKQGRKLQLSHGYENKVLGMQTSIVEICLPLMVRVTSKNTKIFSVVHNITHVGYWNSVCPLSKVTVLNIITSMHLRKRTYLRVVLCYNGYFKSS
jgi:hypothetical protein